MGGKGSGGAHGGGRPRKVNNVNWLKEHPEDISLKNEMKFLEERKRFKEEEKKSKDAVTWLKEHPEDIPLARENLAARETGYAADDVWQLFAAICLKACIDYKRASMGKWCDGISPEKIMRDCHRFFGEDMFQFFVNRISVEEIEKSIRATPEQAIHNLWRKSENKEQPKEAV